MFVHGDRIPADPAAKNAVKATRPWALRLMAPFKTVVNVGDVAVGIDPASQLGIAADGQLIQVKHRRSNTGTESPTATGGGDGQHQGGDQDHSQDSDQD